MEIIAVLRIRSSPANWRVLRHACSVLKRIEELYIDNVLTTLGEHCTPKLESIHRRSIHFIIETLIEGYKIAEKEAQNDQEGFTEGVE